DALVRLAAEAGRAVVIGRADVVEHTRHGALADARGGRRHAGEPFLAMGRELTGISKEAGRAHAGDAGQVVGTANAKLAGVAALGRRDAGAIAEQPLGARV